MKSKRKNETIYETYKRTLCVECNNRKNDKDLCKIIRRLDNSAKCFSYDRCMKTQCNRCKNQRKCDEGE